MVARKPPTDPLVFVIGATGTGKSQIAVDLAVRFSGEIINGDAMQMYNGLPIITNKLSSQEQRGIPHHLLGVVGLKEEPWRVGLFKKEAGRIIKEIRSRGKLPIVVGGTHYYTQSLLFGDALITRELADEDNDVEPSRQEIIEKFPILEKSTPEILEKLKEVDPVMANRWHPKDRRKIRRSLEIYLMTGRKASDVYLEQKHQRRIFNDEGTAEDAEMLLESSPLLASTLILWVHAENDTLKTRLDDRVESMVEKGLIDEVKLLNRFIHDEQITGAIIDRSSGIWVSIGFKEFEPYISAVAQNNVDAKTLETLLGSSIEQTKAATRQYAKRQVRWIRLKLLPALIRENGLEKLYLLDGSNLASWSDEVKAPGMAIVQAFLDGDELPPPSELSPLAKELLTPKRSFDLSDRPDLWVNNVCDICNTTSVTEEQWQAHIKSRGHKARVKRAKRNDPQYKSRSKVDDPGSREIYLEQNSGVGEV